MEILTGELAGIDQLNKSALPALEEIRDGLQDCPLKEDLDVLIKYYTEEPKSASASFYDVLAEVSYKIGVKTADDSKAQTHV